VRIAVAGCSGSCKGSLVYRHLNVEERGDVALVRIDRPPANALDLELLDEGKRLAAELAASDPGAVVVIGRDRFFSAGVDLKLAPTLDAAGQREMVVGINALFAAWYGFPRPVVAAVNGHAIAGGLILALCADYRVGAPAGSFGLTELRAGIPYPSVAMAVVRAELTAGVARRLVLGAELVGPHAALELGLVDELHDRVLERGIEVAAELARLPRSAYPVVKRQLRGQVLERIEAMIGDEGDPTLTEWLGAETADASGALLSGRGRGPREPPS
jgi:enoyl-CoA hydratase